MQNPAISVIIPMYNAEKFIGTCLESLLIQTFRDFEVIVVDDCSTDKSVAIVESYADKFNGRLTLSSTKTNSGGGGYVPRNIGLGLSRGDYVYFVDADDFIVETALEILHAAVETFDADVVYTSTYYSYTDDENFSQATDGTGTRLKADGAEDKPTVTRSDPNANLQQLLFEAGFRSPWTKFVERRLLVENEIRFPEITSGGDFIWTIQLYCHAKKLLRLPIALYFYRQSSAESISRKSRSLPEQLSHWISAFVTWLNALNETARATDVLRQNPPYLRQAGMLHLEYCLQCCKDAQAQLETADIYKALARDFPDDLIVPYLFSALDEQVKSYAAKQGE